MEEKSFIAALCCVTAIACPQVLTAQEFSSNEVKAVTLSQKWMSKSGLVTRGPDGKVVFLFGEVQPSIVCAPLQVCDIELEAGEALRDVLIGDTVRWKVEPASSGEANAQAIHLIVKPSEPGLVTSMVITTTRRTYHLKLRSHQSEYMARVGFEYPQNATADFTAINARLMGGPSASTSPEQLNFSYSVKGAASWRPKRVYTDGLKTYIQFPKSIEGQDAPVLFVTSGGQNRIVNYRIKRQMMIVDYVIDQAVLLSGVGWHQRKITIKRGG